MKTVLVSEPMHPDGDELLATRDDIRVLRAGQNDDLLKEYMPEADAVVIRVMMLPAELLATATNLKVVSRHGVGCDNIDVGHLSARNIPCAIAVDSNTTSVVEHVVMMMLSLNKRANQYDALTRDGQFSQRSKLFTSELYGKHILIVGFGRIGKRLAPVCKALGMRVTVSDIALDKKVADDLGVDTVDDWRSILPTMDYLSVHVPLDDSTRDLVGEVEIAALPNHAIVINCARGGIMNEAALAAAVQSGKLAATGADVFQTEPPAADNPLLALSDTVSIFTPHNAAGTIESQSRMATYAVQNALDGLDGKLTSERIFNAADLD